MALFCFHRVVVDVLLTAGYQRLVLLAGGGGVWGLRQCDMTAVEPTAPITSVALTQLSAGMLSAPRPFACVKCHILTCL